MAHVSPDSFAELPFLLKLVDDPSPRVREKIAERLRAWGPRVRDEIEARAIALSPSQSAALDELFARDGDEQLRDEWRSIWADFHADDLAQRVPVLENTRLERSLLALCEWQSGAGASERAKTLLDTLADEFRASQNRQNAVSLAHYLFDFRGLRGATPSDYYAPVQSNLLHALEGRGGLPITLACIFILVGARLELPIEGCNFPGHFLARDARRGTIFDPYNGGRVLAAREVATLQKAAPFEMANAASARVIIERIVRNLALAFHQEEERERAEWILGLLRELG